ncbi:hypothetical protein O4215_20680 [Rhodococcus maanshanensis]|uniref:hypothetical protein n=1 Tax=Rhodococcus maanshanensis TaxID=183556 RepID=UPI0022B46E3A|nr:hypothetical protein [Rhodococcus maanshanensis]MCZ4557981.1 hypothetical protein [Rhodococcus maanshanensis]
MRTYATEADVAGKLLELPDNVDSLIESASILVGTATLCDRYDTTPAGLPTHPDVIEAMRDATVRQVVEWAKNDVDPDAGVAGLEALPSNTSINGATVGYNNAAQAAALAESTTSLCPAGYKLLRLAGLASSSPRSW